MITQFMSVRSNSHNFITLKEFISGCASYDDVRPADYHRWSKAEREEFKMQQMAIKPHGEFKSLHQDSFQCSSGFVYSDIDRKDNVGLDVEKTKSAARKLPGLVAAKRSFNDGVALFFAVAGLDELSPAEFAAVSHWLRGEVERELNLVTDPKVCHLGASHFYASDRSPVFNESVTPINYPESILSPVSARNGIGIPDSVKKGEFARPVASGVESGVRSGADAALMIFDEWTDGRWFPKFLEGERHTKLLTFVLRHCGLKMNRGKTDTNVYELARAANILGCRPMLNEKEADDIARSAVAYRHGWSGHTPAFRQRQSERGQKGMASRWRDKPDTETVVQILGQGLTQRKVAERLGISERTVRRRIKVQGKEE